MIASVHQRRPSVALGSTGSTITGGLVVLLTGLTALLLFADSRMNRPMRAERGVTMAPAPKKRKKARRV